MIESSSDFDILSAKILQFVPSVPQEELLDTVFRSYGTRDHHPLRTVLFGPKFMAKNLYQLSPVQVRHHQTQVSLLAIKNQTNLLFVDCLSVVVWILGS